MSGTPGGKRERKQGAKGERMRQMEGPQPPTDSRSALLAARNLHQSRCRCLEFRRGKWRGEAEGRLRRQKTVESRRAQGRK